MGKRKENPKIDPELIKSYIANKHRINDSRKDEIVKTFFWPKKVNEVKIIQKERECPPGVMVKVMDCRIVVSEFVLQSRYYVHFRTNSFGMNSQLWVK